MSILKNCPILCAMAFTGMAAPAIALADSPAGPAFTELGHDFPGFDAVYQARLAVADFDHDGKDDLAFAGFAGLGMAYTSIHVVGKGATGGVQTKQSLLIPSGGGPTRLLTFSDASTNAHLLFVEGDGTVLEWSGWPLEPVRTFHTIDAPSSAVVGDIDADGIPELVVRNATTLAAYSLTTAAQKWSIPSGGEGELQLAQLDADNALEIILGGTSPGRIIDGATQMEDWSYPDSFGTSIAAGHLGSAAAHAFVGAASRVTVFSGMPYSPLWDYTDALYFQVSALDVADIDGDGVSEIIFNASSSYAIEVLDSVTRQPRATYSSGYNGVGSVTTLSLDGNASRQIAFADSGSVTVLDGLTGAPVWSLQSRNASLAVAAVGDINGDGRTDLLTAAGFVPWNRPAGLEVRDLASGATTWLSDPTTDEDVYATAPYRIRVIKPLTPTGEEQVLIAGTALYDGRVLLVGGRTHTLELKLGEYGAGPFSSRAVKDAVMVDMDGDGVDDILAASEPQLSWVTGARLDAYTQAGDLIWESVGMGTEDQRINGVFAIPPSLGADDVVAVLPTGLRAYGRLSHLLDWTMEVPNDAAFLVEHGANGPEIAFEKDNVLSFYDASTRAFLRGVTLTDAIDAATPLDGDVHRLLISSGGHLALVNGIDGTEMARSTFLGDDLAKRDQLAVETLSPGLWRIGVGSDIGVYRYRLELSDRIFESGFELTP